MEKYPLVFEVLCGDKTLLVVLHGEDREVLVLEGALDALKESLEILAEYPDQELIRLGSPEELINHVTNLDGMGEIGEKIKEKLPQECFNSGG